MRRDKSKVLQEAQAFFGFYSRLRRPSDIKLFESISKHLESPSNTEILRILMTEFAANKRHKINL